MKKRRGLWLIIAGVLVLATFGFLWLNGNGKEKVAYRTDKVIRGDLEVNISATGSLSADTTVQVGSQVSGRIAKLYADFNTVVKKGQLLAQLDPTFLEAALEQAKAAVTRARASLNQAQRDYDRTKGLFEKGLSSQADMDVALTNFESAQASLEQAEAAYKGSQVNLQYATIRSPISGVVISRNVDVGQTVAASLSAPTLFEIANDLRKMQVQASVDEADIGHVKEGQSVTFRVDAYPNLEFNGTVRQIRLAPVINQNVVTYNVIIGVSNPDMKLMPGMTATVSIVTAKTEDALQVPLQALRFTPPDSQAVSAARAEFMNRMRQGQGGDRSGQGRAGSAGTTPRANRGRVWILQEGKLKPVMVRLGIQDTRYAEVVGGDLKEGEEVIVGATGGEEQVTGVQRSPFQPQMGGRRRGGL